VDSAGTTIYANANAVNTNGINTLALYSNLPVTPDYLQLQVQQSGTGPLIPNIISASLEFQYV